MSRKLIVGILALVLGSALAAGPALASGGSGGGGTGGGSSTYVLQGYLTDIDPDASTITIGTSYYTTGTVVITADTKVTRNGVNCTADDLELGDFASVKVNYSTRTAVKVEATGP